MKRTAALLSICVVFAGCTLTKEKQCPPETVSSALSGLASSSAVSPLVGASAPQFTADAVMPDDSFAKLSLVSYRGKYVILFFYPMDFTFVCPTEIIAFDKKLEEFSRRNCAVIGVSVDSRYTHLAWKKTPRDKGGIGAIRYPLVSDITKRISRAYRVLTDESVALRGLFIIDPEGKIRHALVNDLAIGRSVDEAIRTLDAVIFVDTHGDEVCPADWHPGRKAVKTTFDGIADYLSGNSKEEKEKK